jgi:hypothetical protein
MPFFFTMPISRITPTSAMIVKSMPASCSVSSAPSPAEGRVERIESGWMKLS